MMRPLRILGALGSVARIESFLLLIPIPVSLHWGTPDTSVFGFLVPRAVPVFLGASLLCAAFWIPALVATRRAREEDMLEREGVLTVALGWIMASLFGMVPFIALRVFDHSGPVPGLDAFFEAMSGFTGTGFTAAAPATVATMDKGLLLWRALMPFVGGIGIIVLFVALLSKLQQSTIPLVPAEAGGHAMRRLRPKLQETARTLLLLYLAVAAVLWVVLTAILLAAHERVDEALFQGLAHVLSGYSTGGFATDATARLLENPAFATAMAGCMLLGATNFTLLFLLLRRGDRRILKDPEWRFWLIVLVVATIANTAILWHNQQALASSLRSSAYTVTAFSTGTAGLATNDYAAWPPASQLLLILLMFIGGMSGSAAGGVKGSRWLVLLKMLGRELRRILHPRAVIPVRLGDRVLKEETLTAVAAFFFTYLAIWIVGTLAITATDGRFLIDSGAFAAAAALGNAGGGIFTVGPAFSYAAAAGSTKLILCALMWAGRLELFAALLVFNPKSWKN